MTVPLDRARRSSRSSSGYVGVPIVERRQPDRRVPEADPPADRGAAREGAPRPALGRARADGGGRGRGRGRHLPRLVLVREGRGARRRRAWRPSGRASTERSPTSTSWTRPTRRSSSGAWRWAAAASLWEVDATVVDLIPNGARGRDEGRLLDRLDLRPVRRRRPRQRRREHPAGPLPRVPPGPDRARAELRAASWAGGSSVSWPCICCSDEAIRKTHGLDDTSRSSRSSRTSRSSERWRSSSSSPRRRRASIKAFATFVAVDRLRRSRCRCGGPSTAASDGYQFVEKASWIPSLGVNYHFGIDGISLVLILLTTLMGVIAVVLLVLGDHGPAEGVLRPPAAAPDLHDRDVLLPGPLPLLRVLGSDAGADVLPDRRLGRPAAALRGDQVLPVHAGGVGADAARHHRALLLQHDRVPRVQGPRQRADVLDRDADGGRAAGCRRSCRSGSSSRSSWASRSRCRCSRSTRGCPTPIPRRRRRARSSWRRSS